jgi:quercetin dioxygenase-like cupin family protein
MSPGTEVPPHILDREQIFFAVSGGAAATLGGEGHTVHAGDALIVPSEVVFALAVLGQEPFEAVTVMPVGRQARYPEADSVPFSPPWTV